MLLLSGPGFFLSSTLKGAILYLTLRIALSGLCKCFECNSLGPYTAAIILFLPHSIYAEPFAFFKTPTFILIGLSSYFFLPSILLPFSSINLSPSGFSIIIIHLSFLLWFLL
ncbi:111aa long hypothetical protein [Pyrococcus horikoshii OT3]|uniref:Uncharacterized protein n=1 Tax=Pyrococcus horikoshii (strain ATCC 700860 / DSM 12428 / JCM 9974 / NBRC 100139 / OT-3) TaxID=70601 RepID=O59222_PYRHO|nr:111aa long hypothetical protein [Pyrococcus horikoshii OT3]